MYIHMRLNIPRGGLSKSWRRMRSFPRRLFMALLIAVIARERRGEITADRYSAKELWPSLLVKCMAQFDIGF